MKVMKLVGIVSALILAAYAVFALVWLWGNSISWTLFVKVTVTAAVLLAVIVVLGLIYREYVEEKEMTRDKFLD